MRWLPVYFLLLTLFSGGCTGLRYLEEGTHLYTGHKIDIETEEKDEQVSRAEAELNRVVRPVPNSSFLFSRPRLWMYYAAGEPAGKGLRHLMKNRFGRPPVLFEPRDIDRNLRLMENRLFNLGYFDAKINFEEKLKEKTASVHYRINLRSPYLVGALHEMPLDSTLSDPINLLLQDTKIRPGQPYNLDRLKAERIRIDKALKEDGYFYFHPDYILFRADSVSNARTVDIYPSLKSEMLPEATRQYRIGDVDIFVGYPLDAQIDENRAFADSIRDGMFLFEQDNHFKSALFDRAVFLRKGADYRASDHDMTLVHLTGLGVFQFVNLRISPRQASQENLLDMRLILTPAPKKSLSAELIGLSKSNNFAGPGFNASFTNINLFGGAENLRVGINMAYETLLGGGETKAISREFGIESTLLVPQMAGLPDFLKPKVSRFVPKTNISLSASHLSRTDAFTLTSLNLQYGYEWNQSLIVRHRLSPLMLNIFVLGKVYDNLERLVADGSLLRRGLFEQFIIGSGYSWFYNSQLKEPGQRSHHWYVNANLDVSGNLPYLISEAISLKQTADNEYQIFGKGFSQFTRADIDLRYYHNLGAGQRLATRLIAGLGMPYGNSTSLPYLKLFAIGGSNSIRAFHPRSLGPGTYVPPDSLSGGFNIYQSGEMKLELSAEYRFAISSIFKGAVFADAGNIWRINENASIPGGMFRWSTFLGQMALGSGVGLRIDATLFVLRFDFAIPLAIPGSGREGFLDPIQPLNRQWRRDNLVFNLAIGYPF